MDEKWLGSEMVVVVDMGENWGEEGARERATTLPTHSPKCRSRIPAALPSTTGTNRRCLAGRGEEEGGAATWPPLLPSAASNNGPVSTSRKRGAATYAPTRVAPLHSGEARMWAAMAEAV